jgi:hypothetical protein
MMIIWNMERALTTTSKFPLGRGCPQGGRCLRRELSGWLFFEETSSTAIPSHQLALHPLDVIAFKGGVYTLKFKQRIIMIIQNAKHTL